MNSHQLLRKRQELLRKQYEASQSFNRLELRELEKLKDQITDRERQLRRSTDVTEVHHGSVTDEQSKARSPLMSTKVDIERITVYNKNMSSICEDFINDLVSDILYDIAGEMIAERERVTMETNTTFADIIMAGLDVKVYENMGRDELAALIDQRQKSMTHGLTRANDTLTYELVKALLCEAS